MTLQPTDSDVGPLDIIGHDVLAWVANVEASELTDDRIAATPAVLELIELSRSALERAGMRGVPPEFELHDLSVWDETGSTLRLNTLRQRAGGELPTVSANGGAEAALQMIARDVAPLTLLPGFARHGLLLLGAAVHRHPRHQEFMAAVRSDAVLGALFREDGQVGPQGSASRSTGTTGTIQLVVFAELVIFATAALLRIRRGLNPHALVGNVCATLEMIREATRREIQVPAWVAFTNVRFGSTVQVRTPWGVLRSITDAERREAPPGLRGHLVHHDSPESSVAISYAGDVVLETLVPYRLHGGRSGRPQDYVTYPELYRKELRCLTAITLGAERNPPVSPMATWRAVFDPLHPGLATSWSDRRHSFDPPPALLLDPELRNIEITASDMARASDSSIELALRRLQSALSFRSDWSDRLVDAAIAWENLLGSHAEQRLRLSTALAWLVCPDDPTDRDKVQREAMRLYDIRSAIAHGTGVKEDSDLRSTALRLCELVIQALRALYRSRADLIPEEDRGRLLLLGLRGTSPTQTDQRPSSPSPYPSPSSSSR